jgi:hypothetical protein
VKQNGNVQLGEIGEKAVEYFFLRLGWGPLPTGRQDLGTDYFVQIRDAERVDLRLLIGVQVKTGSSSFDEPDVVNGRAGWWFRDSRNHGDYWINHHVPHIVVLQSEDTVTTAWATLDSHSIISTGKDVKVFVPADQKLDRSRAADWIALAAEARRLISFEGSRWSFDITQLPPEDWPRHALLAPRLVSPHVNRGYSNPINWAEAIALCAEANPERWDHFAAQHPDVPSPEAAPTSKDPGWRLAGAIYGWVTGEVEHALESFVVSGASPAIRAAHAVCLSIDLVDDDRPEDAIQVLDAALTTELSADQAWLGVHKARILAETGNVPDGLALFQNLTVGLSGLKSDVTVSAIRSAAIWAQFELTQTFDRDLGAVIPALDTAASWWRTQAISAGLEEALNRTFDVWAPTNAIALVNTDVAHNQLFSSALVARLAGDHGNWRNATTLMAMVDLSTKRPQNGNPGAALDALRRAGDHKRLGRALKKTLDVGPLADVVKLVADMSPTGMTKTSWRADLEVLRRAGSYATSAHAVEFVEFLIAALVNPQLLRKKLHLRYTPEEEILRALEGLASQMDDKHVVHLLDYVLDLNDHSSQGIEPEVERFLRRADAAHLAEFRERLTVRATELNQEGWVAKMIWRRLDGDDDQSRDRKRRAILAGDVQAISTLATIVALQPDEVDVMVAVCRSGFEGYRANRNGLMLAPVEYSQLCALLALEFPESEAFAVLTEFIQDPTGYAGLKRKGMKVLAERVSEIPDKYRSSLGDSLRKLRLDPPPEGDEFDRVIPRIGGAFHELLLEVAPEDAEYDGALAAMLTGDEQSRFDAADYLSRHPGNELLLLTMTRDENFRVSHRSMLALARIVSETAQPATVYLTALAELLGADGEANASFILNGLAARSPMLEHVDALLSVVEAHPSSEIRSRVEVIRAKG